MRTLFFRIFLWFWLAMAAVAGVLIVSSPLFTRGRPGVGRWERDAARMLDERLSRLSALLRHEGTGPFRAEADRGDPGRPDRFFLLDTDGRDVLGARPPRTAAELARRTVSTGVPATEREGALHLAAAVALDPSGKAWVVVQTIRRPPGLVDLLDPAELAPRLLVLVLIAGVLCSWLAHHLSAPVAAVRAATRRLAEGDLSARVGETVGRRRDDIADLARDVDAMAERVVDLVSSQRRLVRDVSHELRSPLARLRVALELARAGPEEKRERALARIEEEADRLAAMIEQLLALSRLDTGVEAAERVPCDLAALASAVVADASFEAGARGATVRLEAEGPCPVVGSPSLLLSAIENVVRNGVRHTAPGTEVTVRVAGAGAARAVVTVRDHGPGVPGELLPRIFEPFFRVDDARGRETGGTGLGLAIAARAVELHGGTIAARNAPGGGLEVELAVPASPAAGPGTPAA